MEANVGLSRIEATERREVGTVRAFVLYPTAALPEQVDIGPYSLRAALDAPPLPAGTLPTVIVSHGSGSSPLVHRTLAEFLAANGCLVCLVEHPGNNRTDNRLEGTFENLCARPAHVRAVVDHLESSNEFSGSFSRNKLVIVGHSLGGHTALSVAGGRPDTSLQVAFCRRPESAHDPVMRAIAERMPPGPVPVGDSLDPAGLVLMAPGAIDFDHEEGLTRVSAPVLLYTAEFDEESHAHADVVRERLARNGREVDFRRIDNATHYAFLSPFPDSIRDRVGPAGRDRPGFDRIAFHGAMHAEILDFVRKATVDI